MSRHKLGKEGREEFLGTGTASAKSLGKENIGNRGCEIGPVWLEPWKGEGAFSKIEN